MGWSIEKMIMDVSNSTSLNGIFNNPIYTAVLIVFIIAVIIVFMFRPSIDPDEPFWNLLFRYSIYSFLPIISIVFIHYKNLERDFEKKYGNQQLESVVEQSIGREIKVGTSEAIKPSPAHVPPVVPVTIPSIPITPQYYSSPQQPQLYTMVQSAQASIQPQPVAPTYKPGEKIFNDRPLLTNDPALVAE